MECWPRGVDVTKKGGKQFLGWPVTIDQADNYARKAAAYLPTINLKGYKDLVVQVIDESDGSVVYTIRMKGQTFQPKVFKPGKYTIVISDGKNEMNRFKHQQALKDNKIGISVSRK
jgi:hypothetical protein